MPDFQSSIDTWCSERTCSTWRGRRPAVRGVELRKNNLDVLLLKGITEDPFDPLCFAIRSAYRCRRNFLGLTDGDPRYDDECIVVTGQPEFEYSHTPQDTDHFTSVRWLPDALSVVAGLCEIMRDSYPNFFSQRPTAVDRQRQLRSLFGVLLRNLLSRKSYVDYIAYSKWWTTWYLAEFLHQELPVPPSENDRLPFEGDLRRFLRMRLLDGDRTSMKNGGSLRRFRAWRFFNSFQQLKRCSNPVPSSFVADCLGKHMRTMGQEKLTHLMEDVPLEDQEDVIRTVSDGDKTVRLDLQDFRAKVRQVMQKFRAPAPRLYAASTSAGFDISRDSGGQQAEIYHRLGGCGPMRVVWCQPRTVCCEVGDRCRNSGIGSVMSDHVKKLPADILQIVGMYAYGDEDMWELHPPPLDEKGKCIRSKVCNCRGDYIAKCASGDAGFHIASFEVPDEIVRHDDLVAMYYRPLDGVWEVRGIPLPRACDVRDMILTGQHVSDESDFSGGLNGVWTRRWPRSRFSPFVSPSPLFEEDREEYARRSLESWRWISFRGFVNFGNRPAFRQDKCQERLNPIRRHDDLGPPDFFPNCLRARIVPVLEPWKVRTISAGESFPYWYARYFQKATHEYLRSIPQFQFIGQSLTGYALSQFFRRFDVPAESQMVSGDYSGATDGVSITLTEICHEETAWSVKDPLSRVILDRVIGSHRCHYDGLEVRRPSNIEDMVERGTVPYDFQRALAGRDIPPPVLQNNGQLMGSVLSFPYLCLINFVGTWQTVFPHIERFEDVPILVNGDDIFFFTDKKGYDRWLLGLDFMGFTRSLGKNFYHHEFGYMNSVPFQYDWKQRKFELFPFYNVGLMYGRQRVSGGLVGNKQQVAELADGEPLGAVPLHLLQPKAVEGASNQARAAARFQKIHTKYLQRVSRSRKQQMNYYLPVEFGGLGMICPKRQFVQVGEDPDVPTWGFKTEVTPWQAGLWRRCAAYYQKPFLDVPPFPKVVSCVNGSSSYTVKRWRIGHFGPAPMVCKSDNVHQQTVLRIQKCTPIDSEVNWTRRFRSFFGTINPSSVTPQFRDMMLGSSVTMSDMVYGRGLLPSLLACLPKKRAIRGAEETPAPVPPLQVDLPGDRVPGAAINVEGELRVPLHNADGWFVGWQAHDERPLAGNLLDQVDEYDDEYDLDMRYEDAVQSML